MTRSLYAAAAIAAAMFLLWLILGREPNMANLVAGIATAAALALWAPLADL